MALLARRRFVSVVQLNCAHAIAPVPSLPFIFFLFPLPLFLCPSPLFPFVPLNRLFLSACSRFFRVELIVSVEGKGGASSSCLRHNNSPRNYNFITAPKRCRGPLIRRNDEAASHYAKACTYLADCLISFQRSVAANAWVNQSCLRNHGCGWF